MLGVAIAVGTGMLMLLTFCALILGLVAPSLVLKSDPAATRVRVLKVYGGVFVLGAALFLLFGYASERWPRLLDPSNPTVASGFAFATMLCLVALAVGLIEPRAVIFRGEHRTRRRVIKIYGLILYVLLMCFFVSVPTRLAAPGPSVPSSTGGGVGSVDVEVANNYAESIFEVVADCDHDTSTLSQRQRIGRYETWICKGCLSGVIGDNCYFRWTVVSLGEPHEFNVPIQLRNTHTPVRFEYDYDLAGATFRLRYAQ